MYHPLRSVPKSPEAFFGSVRTGESGRRICWIDDRGSLRSLVDEPVEGDLAESVWSSLLNAVLSPREGPRKRPWFALFPDVDIVAALQDRAAASGIELCYHPDLIGPALSYRCEPALVAAFFEAASSFVLQAPWLDWDPAELLVLEGLAEDALCATLLGDGEDPAGLVLFRSLEALEAFRQGELGGVEAWMSLESAVTVGPQFMAEVAEQGWRLPGCGCVPVGMGRSGELAGPADLRLLCRAMEAVERYSDHERTPLRLSDGTRIRVHLESPLTV